MKKTLTAPAFTHYPDEWHLSPVLDTGEFLFFSGVTGVRPDGSLAAEPEEQIRDVFTFLNGNLEAAGLTFDEVVEMTSYHVNLRRHIGTFIEVKDRFVGPPYPAWTAIGVNELITEGTIVEVRIIARQPD